MPAVIRKISPSPAAGKRREIVQAVHWQVKVNANLWSPPTDLYETEGEYVVRVEVAGMRDVDIEVAAENDILVISGVRPDLPERRAYHQMEIRFGKFTTAVGLPGPVDFDRARAEYDDGFLVVILPRKLSAQVHVEE